MMLTYRHIKALEKIVKQPLYAPVPTTQIILIDHHTLTHHVGQMWFPIEWQLVDRVWVGHGGAMLFLDPDLEPEEG